MCSEGALSDKLSAHERSRYTNVVRTGTLQRLMDALYMLAFLLAVNAILFYCSTIKVRS